MLFKKKKKSRVYKYYRLTPAGKKRRAQKIDYAIFILLIMLGCFGISLAKKWGEVNKGTSDEYGQTPIRIQILNASGNPQLAQISTEKLSSMTHGPLSFEIVEKGNYGAFKLPQSMIVYLKEEEEELAHLAADWLGINRDNVLFQKVENNYLDIQMKLIVGRDFKFLPAQPSGEEVAQTE